MPAPTKSVRAQSGFTLLELIIVLFIVGLASSVVLFSAGRLRDRTVFNEEARKIYQTMKRARELSLLGRRELTFRLDEHSGRYWVEGGDGKTFAEHTLRQGYVLAGTEVTFFPKGNSSGGLVKINDGKGREYAIEVDPVLGTPSIKRL